ncbi:MAG: hypothetical protein JRJ46_04675 [Deltaproteobacteria bacterium]|nr:hypothetical protein [Deltaproteobacteria bacterium]
MGITWNQFYTGYKVHSKGKAVACLLFQTFQLFARANSISDVYILVQYTSDLPPDERELMHNLFLDCTDGQSVVIVNLWEPLAAVKKQAPKRFELYYDRHMTYEGNYFVAQQLLKAMNNR